MFISELSSFQGSQLCTKFPESNRDPRQCPYFWPGMSV